jgi:hypothetical protein
MTRTKTSSTVLALTAAGAMLFFGIAGCKSSSNTSAPITNATDAGNDAAADGNLAPVDNSQSTSSQPTQVLGTSSSYTPQQQSESYSQAPADQGNQDYNNGTQAVDQSDDQPSEYASQAPPPLPEYDQPPAPDPNYLWTPGYWGWGDSGGYYWVPGVWCPPPYYGALWTPPYWGFYGGRYGFHRGYWGPHIGFYGGVDYGFGYIGIGFFGGYWRGHDFYYNRSVTNVGRVGNVYSRNVVYNNVHYGMQPSNRVSFNGGRGGINVQPRPAERAAMRESRTAPIAAQMQVRQQAAQNRGNLYSANHGKPAEAAMGRPIAAAHIAEAPRAVQQEQQRSAQIQQHNAPGAQPQRGAEPQRGAQPNQPNRGVEPQRPVSGAQQRGPEPMQQHTAPAQQQRPVETHQSAPIQRSQPTQQSRPQPAARPAPESRPQPQQQARPTEQPRPQAAPQSRPAPEARPAPAPAARPAPAPRPAPAAHPAPSGGHDEHPR